MRLALSLLLLSLCAIAQDKMFLDNQTGYERNADILRSELKGAHWADTSKDAGSILRLTCGSSYTMKGQTDTDGDARATVRERHCSTMTLALLNASGDVQWVNTRSLGNDVRSNLPLAASVFMKKPKPLAYQLAHDYLSRH